MKEVERFTPDINNGLTSEQVNNRLLDGLNNYDSGPKSKSIKEIIASNCFTFFNMLNITLGASVFCAGLFSNQIYEGIKNCLFIGIIFVNSFISIVEEIISKKIIDRLSLLSESKVTVIRDGKEQEKNVDEIVLDDIVKLRSGHQVVCDAFILKGEVEVNESFITGESEPVTKKKGDLILSGSFIVSGVALSKVEHIGEENYVGEITKGAKYVKKANSIIMESFEKILKIISVFIVPIGIVMFASQLVINNFNITSSVFGTVAALTGMIPEGLVLLTSSVMAVSIIRLSKYKVLVQKLYSIETLARVDVICLDKTGTLTEGKMKLKEVIPYEKTSKRKIDEILNEISNNTFDNNSTIMALKDKYKEEPDWKLTDSIPFSSTRKFSGYKFKGDNIFYLGAPEILFPKNKKINKEIKEYQSDYRVLILASSEKLLKSPKDLKPLAYILIEDIIRKNAKKTIEYFTKEGVDVKIISGDSISTVLEIARKCGLTDIRGVDVSELSDRELCENVEDYDIFGRVTPTQKKVIVEHLQKGGHTVAMTGDGVNDCLALKASDCGIALASGSESARNVSELVLLDSNFDSLPKVVKEGRRTINNIERSSSLLLVKTIYTILLIILSILVGTKYFFVPIQLTLITGFTIGIPSFILALEPNNELVSGNFLKKIIGKSLPVSLTVVFNIIVITILQKLLNLSFELTSTMSVLLTSMTGFIYLFKICKPFNTYRISLYIFLLIGFISCAYIGHDFFDIASLNFNTIIICILLFPCSIFIYKFLNRIFENIFFKN